MQRRSRHVRQRRQRRDERRQASLAAALEQDELPFLGHGLELGGGLFEEAVDAKDHAGTASFELDRLAPGPLNLTGRLETTEHPADRRRLVRGATGVDRA